MKMECDFLYGWNKKTVTYANMSLKMVNPRDIAGNAEGEEEDYDSDLYTTNPITQTRIMGEVKTRTVYLKITHCSVLLLFA